MSRERAMRAGLILIVLAVQCAGIARAEPRVLWQMKFDESLIPEVHPLRSHHILRLPVVLEDPAGPPIADVGPVSLFAKDLLDTSAAGVGKVAHGRVTPGHLLRKPIMRPSRAEVKHEAFGLVKKMPQAYAGMMFCVGWLLLLTSVGLGYLGRRVEPYTEGDPATWHPEIQRPLAPILIDADELRTVGAYPDRRL